MSLITCAKCCTIFSFTGIIFLIIIGSLLETQPLYIKGPTDSAAAAKGCYEGAIIYVATFLLSLGYWIYDGMRSKVAAAANRGQNTTFEKSRFGGKYGAVSYDEGAL